MALSRDEKALVESTHERIRLWRKYRWGGFGGAFAGAVPGSVSIIKIIENPHSSHREVAVFSALIALVWGVALVSAFVFSRQRKRDEQLVRFFESRFPDDCSWKQEEKILAEAEDIRLKAKVAILIHNAAR